MSIAADLESILSADEEARAGMERVRAERRARLERLRGSRKRRHEELSQAAEEALELEVRTILDRAREEAAARRRRREEHRSRRREETSALLAEASSVYAEILEGGGVPARVG